MLKIHINHLFSDLKPENKNRNRVMTQNVVREENFRTAVACSTVRVLKKKNNNKKMYYMQLQGMEQLPGKE